MSPGFLDGEVTTLAWLWRLLRTDGVVLGFTSHDRPIRAAGVLHLARPGMTPSAVSVEDGFRTDSMEIAGALTADAVRAGDLENGRWHGALVELELCDWTRPEEARLAIARGRIGDVVRRGDGDGGWFAVELLSEMAALARAGLPRCSAMCRATLGDGRCQVDMEGRSARALALEVEEARIRLETPPAVPERFAHGVVRFLDGPHAGIDRPVAGFEGTWLGLVEPVPALGAGRWRVRLLEGCDRRFETCATRFDNALQFDGEPHVPGTDALVRYAAD